MSSANPEQAWIAFERVGKTSACRQHFSFASEQSWMRMRCFRRLGLRPPARRFINPFFERGGVDGNHG
jgi:hypothetical protein